MKNNCLILIGMAGVGKSSAGKLLSEMLGFKFIDLDLLIIRKNHKTLQEIIDALGDEAFLALEAKAMAGVPLQNHVIAPGGSIIYQAELLNRLKKEATLVYLEDSFENISKREKERGTGGVIGIKTKSFKEIFDEREPLYKEYADITINVFGKTIKQVAEEIIKRSGSIRFCP